MIRSKSKARAARFLLCKAGLIERLDLDSASHIITVENFSQFLKLYDFRAETRPLAFMLVTSELLVFICLIWLVV